jgi:VWFA-related protein
MGRLLLSLLALNSFSFGQSIGGANVVPVETPAAASVAAPPVTSGKSPVQIRKGILIGALDSAGSPVDGLNKDELQVMDSGQAATPLMVRKASDLPLDLGIVLYADPATFSGQQTAAIDLIKKIIRPDVDHAFVIAAGGSRPWSNGNLQWQNDIGELTKTTEGLERNTGFSDPFGYALKTDRTGLDRNSMQYFGGANGAPSVFGVIWQMMKSDARPVRKAVIIVRNALAHSPGFSGRYSPMVDSSLAYVIGNAQQMGIPFYVIGLEDLSIGTATTNIGLTATGVHPGEAADLRAYDDEIEKERKAAYDAGRSNVMRMADSTGGHAWFSVKRNFADVTDAIAKDVTSQYVLIFSPSAMDVANPRALRITTTHKDCRLETPNAFYLGAH